MAEKDVDKVNEAAEKLTEAVWTSYEAAVESTAAVQESNTRLAQSLFESGIEALKIQAEIKHQTMQSLAEQIRKHQEIFQELSRESLGAYEGFVDSLFSYYKEVLEKPEESDD
jgi:flagellin-specific chaperone FliS